MQAGQLAVQFVKPTEMNMNTKDRRADIRIPLLSGKVVLKGFHYMAALTMDNVSEGGLFLKVDNQTDFLRPKDPVIVQFLLPGELGTLELHGEICRVNWTTNKKIKNHLMGMAVKFWEKPESIKKVWEAYRVYLRNKQIIEVSKRIVEEFFGTPQKDNLK